MARPRAAPSWATSWPSPAAVRRPGPGCRLVAGPSVAAVAPLDGARHWYAFLPAVRHGIETLPTALDEAASVAFEDGTAIRSEVVPLAEVRAAFASILPDGVDVTLYPVDD